MMALHALQRDFQAAVQALSDIPAETLNVRTCLTDKTPPDRMAIYQNNYRTNLIKVLSSIYPVCERLLGQACFRGVAKVFIQAYPSCHPTLNTYGAEFSHFIAAFSPAKTLVYLPAVAGLEWQVYQLANSDNFLRSPWQPERLIDLSPEQQALLPLRLNTSLKLISSNYPIDRIFENNQPDAAAEEIIDLDQGGVHLVLRQEAYQLKILRVSALDWAILKRLEATGLSTTVQALYQQFIAQTSGALLQQRLLYFMQCGFIEISI